MPKGRMMQNLFCLLFFLMFAFSALALTDQEKKEITEAFFEPKFQNVADWRNASQKVEAVVTKSTLSFSGHDLKDLDLSQLKQFEWVTKLELAWVDSFPKEVEALKNLEEITIENCAISNAEDLFDFGEFPKLKTLSLENNELHFAPKSIENCVSLEILSLNDNQLDHLNIDFSKITRLKNLNLSRNCFSSIPKCLKKAQSLTLLSIGGDYLTDCQFDFGELPNLKEIDLSQSQLTIIPPFLGRAPNLSIVKLFRNKIENLDYPFEELNNIQRLDLTYNQVSFVPKRIRGLRKEAILDLTGNPLCLSYATGYEYLPVFDHKKCVCKIELFFPKIPFQTPKAPEDVYFAIYASQPIAIPPQKLNELVPQEEETEESATPLQKESLLGYMKNKTHCLSRIRFIQSILEKLGTKKQKYDTRWEEARAKGLIYEKEFLEYLYLKIKRKSPPRGGNLNAILDHLAFLKHDLLIKSIMPHYDVNQLDLVFQLRKILKPYIQFSEFFELQANCEIPLETNPKKNKYLKWVLGQFYMRFSPDFLMDYVEHILCKNKEFLKDLELILPKSEIIELAAPQTPIRVLETDSAYLHTNSPQCDFRKLIQDEYREPPQEESNNFEDFFLVPQKTFEEDDLEGFISLDSAPSDDIITQTTSSGKSTGWMSGWF